MVQICGKTGTAQVVGLRKDSKHLSEMHRDHAWFVAFAPYEAPEIALSVMIEHGGHGGAVAAPIAKRAIEAYMKSSKQSAAGRCGYPRNRLLRMNHALAGRSANLRMRYGYHSLP